MLRRSAALARCARPTATLSQQQASSTPAAAAAARPFSTQTSKNHETWRGDNDDDALPKVKRRDGSVEVIGNVRGFVDYERNPEPYRAPMERVTDWEEINSEGHDPVERIVQAARCMDCGTPVWKSKFNLCFNSGSLEVRVRCCSLQSVECISRRSCPSLSRNNLTHWLILHRRDAVLPDSYWLSREQFDSRIQRFGLPGPVAQRLGSAAPDE